MNLETYFILKDKISEISQAKEIKISIEFINL